MKISGATAIVTGGNRGIGAAFVRCLLEAGATRVYVGTRELDNAAELAGAFPDRAVPVRLDVTDEAQVAEAAERCGDVSIVVNNAGAFQKQTLLGAPGLEAARQEMEVNYFGTLSMCRHFAPVLGRNGGGAIVNVLSAAAIVAVPGMGGYSPSKFATRALTSCVRAELAGQGTQVSCLIVGSVDTRMAAHVRGPKESPETIARAGLKAIENDIHEMDTDPFAVNLRAALARDPVGLEHSMAELLGARDLSTLRS